MKLPTKPRSIKAILEKSSAMEGCSTEVIDGRTYYISQKSDDCLSHNIGLSVQINLAEDNQGNFYWLKTSPANDLAVRVDKAHKLDRARSYIVYDEKKDESLRKTLYPYGQALDKYISQFEEEISVKDYHEILIKFYLSLRNLHSKGIIHTHIEPCNVIVDLKGEVHIINFEYSRRSKDSYFRRQDITPLEKLLKLDKQILEKNMHPFSKKIDLEGLILDLSQNVYKDTDAENIILPMIKSFIELGLIQIIRESENQFKRRLFKALLGQISYDINIEGVLKILSQAKMITLMGKEYKKEKSSTLLDNDYINILQQKLNIKKYKLSQDIFNDMEITTFIAGLNLAKKKSYGDKVKLAVIDDAITDLKQIKQAKNQLKILFLQCMRILTHDYFGYFGRYYGYPQSTESYVAGKVYFDIIQKKWGISSDEMQIVLHGNQANIFPLGIKTYYEYQSSDTTDRQYDVSEPVEQIFYDTGIQITDNYEQLQKS